MSKTKPQRMLYCSVCKSKYNRTYLYPTHEHHPEKYQDIEIKKEQGNYILCRCRQCGHTYKSRSAEAFARSKWMEYISNKKIVQ